MRGHALQVNIWPEDIGLNYCQRTRNCQTSPRYVFRVCFCLYVSGLELNRGILDKMLSAHGLILSFSTLDNRCINTEFSSDTCIPVIRTTFTREITAKKKDVNWSLNSCKRFDFWFSDGNIINDFVSWYKNANSPWEWGRLDFLRTTQKTCQVVDDQERGELSCLTILDRECLASQPARRHRSRRPGSSAGASQTSGNRQTIDMKENSQSARWKVPECDWLGRAIYQS